MFQECQKEALYLFKEMHFEFMFPYGSRMNFYITLYILNSASFVALRTVLFGPSRGILDFLLKTTQLNFCQCYLFVQNLNIVRIEM